MNIAATKTYFAQNDPPRPKAWRRVECLARDGARTLRRSRAAEMALLRRRRHLRRTQERAARSLRRLVAMPKRFRIVIWEPFLTDAPGPHLASAFCCYINTVIIYHQPYIQSPWRQGDWDSFGTARGHAMKLPRRLSDQLFDKDFTE
jgi:hypothetical protein